MVTGLNDFRTSLLQSGQPTEDINALLLKVIDAPARKERKADRGQR